MENTLQKTAWGTALIAAIGLFLSGGLLVARADTGSISSVSVAPSSNTAVITWNTSTNSTSQVSYGGSTLYSSTTAVNPSLGTAHTVTLTGLSPNTTYHFSVLSADANNATASSTDQTFTTTASGSGSTGTGNTGGVATVTLGASGGAAGSQTSLSGAGFVPYEPVTITFNGNNVGTFTADASGNLTTTLSIPSGTAVGNAGLVVTGASSGRRATGSFSVSANVQTDTQTLQTQIASLQTQITALLARIASIEAAWNSNVSANVSANTSVSSNNGNGLPAGDKLYVGTISDASAIGSGSFTLKTASGATYTVKVASGATVWNKARAKVPLSQYSQGDSVRVDASASGSGTLTADVLRDMSI